MDLGDLIIFTPVLEAEPAGTGVPQIVLNAANAPEEEDTAAVSSGGITPSSDDEDFLSCSDNDNEGSITNNVPVLSFSPILAIDIAPVAETAVLINTPAPVSNTSLPSGPHACNNCGHVCQSPTNASNHFQHAYQDDQHARVQNGQNFDRHQHALDRLANAFITGQDAYNHDQTHVFGAHAGPVNSADPLFLAVQKVYHAGTIFGIPPPWAVLPFFRSFDLCREVSPLPLFEWHRAPSPSPSPTTTKKLAVVPDRLLLGPLNAVVYEDWRLDRGRDYLRHKVAGLYSSVFVEDVEGRMYVLMTFESEAAAERAWDLFGGGWPW
ncbi:hypothetical protein QBC35DRAFT_471085 [Podospora australis]|uniref:Uncharacterized protein n=1 Tax=Podospora australis TaxID=1536484 RepID=A0AAN6X0G1_9PEZI|nr:hypothetical protein QBC35DRAFT_471085 [Podospora australis]